MLISFSPLRHSTSVSLVVALVALLGACSDSSAPNTAVVRITLTTEGPTTLAQGEVTHVTATAYTAGNTVVTAPGLTFSSRATAILLVALACTEAPQQRVGEPSTPAGHARAAFLTLSDSHPPAGTVIAVTAQVRGGTGVIGSFGAKLAFDTAGLAFVDQLPLAEGIRVVNMHGGALLAAGASAQGFTDGRLFTVRLRVEHPDAVRSLALTVGELAERDTESSDPDTPVRRDVVPPPRRDIAPAPSGLIGDVDGDGQVTAGDAELILQQAAGLPTPAGFAAANADANKDGKVSAIDAQIVLSYVVQLDVSQFHVGDDITAPPVSITSIAPATLVPGITATITGENFSPTLAADTVTLDGVVVPVSAATPTQLTVQIPSPLPCTPTHQGVVRVRAAGSGYQHQQTVTAGRAVDMAVGQVRLLDPTQDLSCLELPGSQTTTTYVFAVYNPARAAGPPVPFAVTGVSGSTFAATAQRLLARGVPLNPGGARLARHGPAVRGAPRISPFGGIAPLRAGGLGGPPSLRDALRKHMLAHQRLRARDRAFLHDVERRGLLPLR